MQTVLHLLSMLCVEFIEEIIFRGFLFTIIFYKGKSLLPCIIAHGIFNSLSIFAIQSSQVFKIITALALCAISVAYALWILKKAGSSASHQNIL